MEGERKGGKGKRKEGKGQGLALQTASLDPPLMDNNNNNKHDNVYGAVIMAEPLREFTRFI